ncbi:MAG: efflux RND transporter periplasmic adaptor subunit, partial [Chitinophagales bacterium]
MKQYRGFIWVALIIVALIAIKVLFLKSTTGPSGSGGKSQSVQSVNAIVVKPQVLNNVAILTGSLEANESVSLQPQSGGMITGLYFKEGDFVHKGDLLVKINDADLKAQLQKEEAALEVAQSNLDREDKLYKLSAVSEDDYN